MYNSKDPDLNELPTSAQLVRSTLLALVGAAVLLLTVVLPAEYGIDPTGVGDVLGLKRRGEIKTQLAEEASTDALDDASSAAAPSVPVPDSFLGDPGDWRDRTEVAIAQDEAIELKLVMSEGDRERLLRFGAPQCVGGIDRPRASFTTRRHRGARGLDVQIPAPVDEPPE